MLRKTLSLSLIALILPACTIVQEIEPSKIQSGNELCLIENSKVRESFLIEFKQILDERNILHRVVSETDIPRSCEWTATYTANWRWDLALYLAYVEIKIFHLGNLDGKVTYDSTRGGGNMSKFIDAETKIRELVNELLQYKSALLFSRHFG
jgi:hypothetical protein